MSHNRSVNNDSIHRRRPCHYRNYVIKCALDGCWFPDLSEPQLTVRTDAYQLQGLIIRFGVNHHKVGMNVAIPESLPVSAQCMIAHACIERLIARQHRDDFQEVRIKCFSMLPPGFALEITFEPGGSLNRPHRGPASGCQCSQSASICRRAPPAWH